MGTRCANLGLHASISILSELGPYGSATPRGLTHFPRSYRTSRRASPLHGLTLFPGCVTVATCVCTHVVNMPDRTWTDCFHATASSIIAFASGSNQELGWLVGSLASWPPGCLAGCFFAWGLVLSPRAQTFWKGSAYKAPQEPGKILSSLVFVSPWWIQTGRAG